METYLSDTLKKLISRNPTIKRRYVEYEKTFEEKIKIQDIFRRLERLDKEINNAIDQTSFHNIDAAVKLYRDVLLVKFPDNALPQLKRAVADRHDIVHRNGKTFSGTQRTYRFDEVLELTTLVTDVLLAVDAQIKDALLIPDDQDF